MGNCVRGSQIPLQTAHPTDGAGSHLYRVMVVSERRVAEVEVPPGCPCLKVGELLLEFPPGHFLARFQQADFHIHLQQQPNMSSRSPRAYPMAADSDAPLHEQFVYVLLPMPRLHTRLTHQEILAFAKLFHTHASAGRRQSSTASGSVDTSKGQLVQPTSKSFAALFSISRKVTPILEEVASPSQGSISNEQSDRSPDPQLINAGTHEVPVKLPLISSNHEHLQEQFRVIRPKPWAPKLDTVDEIA